MTASVSKIDMIHITVLDPEGMHIFEEFFVPWEEVFSQLRGIFSVLDTRITFPARINIKKDKYVRKNNISDASSAN